MAGQLPGARVDPAPPHTYDRDQPPRRGGGDWSTMPRARLAATAVPIAFAGLLVCGCSSSNPGGKPASEGGTVAGTLRLRGGPAPGTDRAVSGEVYAFTSISLAGTPTATIKTGSDGRYSLTLPSGTYYLAATTPSFTVDPPPSTPPCRGDKPAVVSAGSASQVDVACQMK